MNREFCLNYHDYLILRLLKSLKLNLKPFLYVRQISYNILNRFSPQSDIFHGFALAQLPANLS